jgi:5-methylcytosine-specific restriction endonuclease McrA
MKVRRQQPLYKWQEKAKEGGICEICGGHHRTLTVDHIVPIAVLNMLDGTGEAWTDWEDNFQLVCHTCNMFKANRLDKTNPKTKIILLKLLN